MNLRAKFNPKGGGKILLIVSVMAPWLALTEWILALLYQKRRLNHRLWEFPYCLTSVALSYHISLKALRTTANPSKRPFWWCSDCFSARQIELERNKIHGYLKKKSQFKRELRGSPAAKKNITKHILVDAIIFLAEKTESTTIEIALSRWQPNEIKNETHRQQTNLNIGNSITIYQVRTFQIDEMLETPRWRLDAGARRKSCRMFLFSFPYKNYIDTLITVWEKNQKRHEKLSEDSSNSSNWKENHVCAIKSKVTNCFFHFSCSNRSTTDNASRSVYIRGPQFIYMTGNNLFHWNS